MGKLKDKLYTMRKTIIEAAEEIAEVKDLSAEEYAAYYGGNYTNFLKAVNSKLFLAKADAFTPEKEKSELEEESFTIELKLASHDNGIFMFDEPKYLGQKETVEQRKIGFLLAKAGMSAYIDTERNVLVIENKKAFDKLNETKDEYLEKLSDKIASATTMAKDKANEAYQEGKEKTGKVIKRGLKIASEWADKNL